MAQKNKVPTFDRRLKFKSKADYVGYMNCYKVYVCKYYNEMSKFQLIKNLIFIRKLVRIGKRCKWYGQSKDKQI